MNTTRTALTGPTTKQAPLSFKTRPEFHADFVSVEHGKNCFGTRGGISAGEGVSDLVRELNFWREHRLSESERSSLGLKGPIAGSNYADIKAAVTTFQNWRIEQLRADGSSESKQELLHASSVDGLAGIRTLRSLLLVNGRETLSYSQFKGKLSERQETFAALNSSFRLNRQEPFVPLPQRSIKELAAQCRRESGDNVDAAFAFAAKVYGLDPLFVQAVRRQESGSLGMRAVSSAGALGYMQLMPDTAASMGANPNDPIENILGGHRYLREQINTFGRLDLALAAYNAGPGAVQRYSGIPPFEETQRYVPSILSMYRRLRPDYFESETPAASNTRLPTAGANGWLLVGDSLTVGYSSQVQSTGGRPVKVFARESLHSADLGRVLPRVLDAEKPGGLLLTIGTNDVAGDVRTVERNIQQMAEQARAHNPSIQLAFGTVPPLEGRNAETSANIARLNNFIRNQLAPKFNARVVDFHAELGDGLGGFVAQYRGDGIHPNSKGYARMGEVASRVIAS